MKKKLIIGSLAVFVAAAFIIALNIAPVDLNAEIPRIATAKTPRSADDTDLTYCIESSGDSANSFRFSGGKYLASTDIRDAASIRNHLAVFDAVTHDESFNRRSLSEVLTKELFEKNKDKWQEYSPDSLLVLLQWAEQFRYFALAQSMDKTFYQAIYGYWMSFIAEKLTAFSREKPSRKYDFKFKYLLTRCKEQNFTTSVKITSEEKFLENIIYGRFGHLVNATWTQSDWKIKTMLAVLIFLMMYGLTFLIIHITKYIKQKL